MRVGFPVFYKDSHTNKTTGVWGDEVACRAQCQLLKDNGLDADLYIKEELKTEKLDISVHTNYQLIHPHKLKDIATVNVLWIQGFTYENGKVIPLDEVYNFCKPYYDLIITSSRVLAKKFNIPFVLPFVGNEPYSKIESNYDLDISFIGNILKPFETNIRYLRPLYGFKYGLFGGDFGKVQHGTALNIISGSKVNLSFGFNECIEWDMVIARPFYQCLCEAVTLMDKVPYYMETFKDSIAFTSGGDDESAVISYLLENEEMRNKMAKEAHDIAKSIKCDQLLKIIKGV